jgi:hypothetical protein
MIYYKLLTILKNHNINNKLLTEPNEPNELS